MLKKRINVKTILKHDTEANWDICAPFVPEKGEIIIYDGDANNSAKLKIGNGVDDVKLLPFVNEGVTDNNFTDELLAKLNNLNNYDDSELSEEISNLASSISFMEGAGYITSDALSDYVTNSSAASTYATKTELSNYVNENELQQALNDNLPKDLGDLTNDAGYIKKDVSDLDNYTTTTILNNELDKKVNILDIPENINSFITSDDVENIVDGMIPTATSDLINDNEFITLDDLGDYATKEELPTKVSDLTNDSNFIDESVTSLDRFYDKDTVDEKIIAVHNTVPNVSSFITKDVSNLTHYTTTNNLNNSLAEKADITYVDTELAKKLDATAVPTKTSDITNNSGFITNTVDNLTKYSTTAQMNELLADKANTTDIPTKVSQLTNDSAFITKSVNNLENYQTTTTVNAALADKADRSELELEIERVEESIPTKTSQIINDSDFVTSSVSDLTNYTTTTNMNTALDNKVNMSDLDNYYTRAQIDGKNYITKAVNDLTNYYTKASVEAIVSALNSVSIEVVETLPTTGAANKIYFIAKTDSQDQDYYDEFIWLNGNAWEKIGSTKIDLTPYATTQALNNAVSGLQNATQVSSSISNALSNYYTKSQVNTALNNKANSSELSAKQDKLASGTNIKTINNTAILGSGNISVQPTLKVGNNITISSDSTISAIDTIYDDTAIQSSISTLSSSKQDNLISGTNIKTINNTSLLSGGNIIIDNHLEKTVFNYVSTDNQTEFAISGTYDEILVFVNGLKVNDEKYSIETDKVTLGVNLLANQKVEIILYRVINRE